MSENNSTDLYSQVHGLLAEQKKMHRSETIS